MESNDDRKFTVIEPVDDIKMTFEKKILKHFKLPNCNTCHSIQGLSINDKVTLFDCNTPDADRNFVWTAITRVRDLDNITYFEHSNDEVEALEESKLKQYLKLKIGGKIWMQNDLLTKRNILI